MIPKDYKGNNEKVFNFNLNLRKNSLQKANFENSGLVENFQDLCFNIVNSYLLKNSDLFEKSIYNLIDVLKQHENEMKREYIDLLPIINVFKEKQIEKLLIDIFNIDNGAFRLDFFSLIAKLLYHLLAIPQFSIFFESFELFYSFCNAYIEYNDQQDNHLTKLNMMFCLFQLFIYQHSYESTYKCIFKNFESLSRKLIRNGTYYMYQFVDLMISINKNNDEIEGKVINEYHVLLTHLPITLEPGSIAFLYDICIIIIKKSNINQATQIAQLLDSLQILDILLSPQNFDTNTFKRLRINLMRWLLLKIDKNNKNYLLSGNFGFDFEMIIQCPSSGDHLLIQSSIKFLNSFIPDSSNQLFKFYNYKVILEFINSILSNGSFKEKMLSLKFLSDIILNSCSTLFIKELVKINENYYNDNFIHEEEDHNEVDIFCNFNDCMQIDQNDIKILILNILVLLYEAFNVPHKENLRRNLIQKIELSELHESINECVSSENDEVSGIATMLTCFLSDFTNSLED